MYVPSSLLRRGSPDKTNDTEEQRENAVHALHTYSPSTADEETIRTVIRSKGNETATVKQLLAMGYPIKKQTVDVLPIHT